MRVVQPELQAQGEDEEHRDEPGEVHEAHRGAEHVGADPEQVERHERLAGAAVAALVQHPHDR
jgi:uncharacterized protein YdaT